MSTIAQIIARGIPQPSFEEERLQSAQAQRQQAEAEQQRLANLQAQRDAEGQRRMTQAILEGNGDHQKTLAAARRLDRKSVV